MTEMTMTHTDAAQLEEAAKKEARAKEVHAQGAAVINRYRELLVRQRDRFQNYLVILEKQRDSIPTANTDELIARVELEERAVAEILSVQKVLDPMEKMCNASLYLTGGEFPEDIPAFEAALEVLKRQAVALSSHNRDLLAARMAVIRCEINILKNHPVVAETRRYVHQNFASAGLIDING
jgi:hypothetical protein